MDNWIETLVWFLSYSVFICCPHQRSVSEMKSGSPCVTLHVCVLLLMHTWWACMERARESDGDLNLSSLFLSSLKTIWFSVFSQRSRCTEKGEGLFAIAELSSFASVTLKWTLCWKNAVTEPSGMHEHRTSESEALNSPQACYVWKCASVLEFRC